MCFFFNVETICAFYYFIAVHTHQQHPPPSHKHQCQIFFIRKRNRQDFIIQLCTVLSHFDLFDVLLLKQYIKREKKISKIVESLFKET